MQKKTLIETMNLGFAQKLYTKNTIHKELNLISVKSSLL